LSASAGVKVTGWFAVPAFGTMPGVVQAKLPGTEAVPPVSVETDSVFPYTMAEAVGHVLTVGVALFTVTLTNPVTVL